jgi:hypothetical protein
MHHAHDRASFRRSTQHKRALNKEQEASAHRWITIMLLAFIAARLRAKPRFFWKPSVTLTDPRIVSELAGSSY